MSEKKWLKEGEKTKITKYVKKTAELIQGKDLELIKNISKFVASLNSKQKSDSKKLPDFRKSTAEQILKRKQINSCIEAGTAFRALCIAKKIPAVFVETLRKKWINLKPNPKNPQLIEGHVFVDVFIKQKWHTTDPGSLNYLHKYKDYSVKNLKLGKYEVMKKGLDSHDLGFNDMIKFRKYVAKKYNKPYLITNKIHIKNKLILSGCLIINDKKELLLLYRKDHKHYETPGGKVKPEDCKNPKKPIRKDLRKTAERELKEELGNSIKITKLKYFGKINFTIHNGRKATANKFLTKIKTGKPKINEPKLFSKLEYLPIKNLEKYPISPDLKLLIKKIKKLASKTKTFKYY